MKIHFIINNCLLLTAIICNFNKILNINAIQADKFPSKIGYLFLLQIKISGVSTVRNNYIVTHGMHVLINIITWWEYNILL